jgi:SulP family sulfate permease
VHQSPTSARRATVIFDTLPGLFIGIGVSFLLLLYRVSAPHIAVLGKVPGTRSQYGDLTRHEENREVPGLLVIRPDGGLFFANADHIRQHILAEVERENPRAVIVDGETMPFIDVTAVEMLDNLTEDLGRRGVTLALARDVGEVRDIVRRAAGPEHAARIYPTVQAAVDALQGPLDT